MVKYLVEHGANIHVFDNEALRWASRNGHLEVVKYLVEEGADIHARDSESLIRAAEEGHLEIVKYLVSKGADIHANNDSLFGKIKIGNEATENYLRSLFQLELDLAKPIKFMGST